MCRTAPHDLCIISDVVVFDAGSTRWDVFDILVLPVHGSNRLRITIYEDGTRDTCILWDGRALLKVLLSYPNPNLPSLDLLRKNRTGFRGEAPRRKIFVRSPRVDV